MVPQPSLDRGSFNGEDSAAPQKGCGLHRAVPTTAISLSPPTPRFSQLPPLPCFLRPPLQPASSPLVPPSLLSPSGPLKALSSSLLVPSVELGSRRPKPQGRGQVRGAGRQVGRSCMGSQRPIIGGPHLEVP